jgi:hypothetical protein
LKTIKLPAIEGGDQALLQSVEAATPLLERLGGPYRPIALALRAWMDGEAVARLARRDAAIIELATRWYGDLSNNAAAAEIAQSLRRYETTTWRRRDALLSDPPPSAFGTARELEWRILREGLGKALGRSRIRQILDESPFANLRLLRLASVPPRIRHDEPEPALNAQPKVEEIIRATEIFRATPEFQKAAARAEDKQAAERQARLDAIAKLNAEMEKAWPRHEKLKAESLAREQDAVRALKAASQEHQKTLGAVAAERSTYESERRAHEEALIAGEWPEISEFIDKCYKEMELARAALSTRSYMRRNARTGKAEEVRVSNSKLVEERTQAISRSVRDALDLRMIADRRKLPAAIEEIIESWRPPLADLLASPNDPSE